MGRKLKEVQGETLMVYMSHYQSVHIMEARSLCCSLFCLQYLKYKIVEFMEKESRIVVPGAGGWGECGVTV